MSLASCSFTAQPQASVRRRVVVASSTQRAASPPEAPRLARRELLAGLCLAAAMACSRPAAAAGEAAAAAAAAAPSEAAAAAATAAAPVAAGSAGEVVPIYFGNGCFWGRQFEFVNAEAALGRDAADISAVVGYAGGRQQGPDGKVCYYYSDELSVYEPLGHAEVVQVELRGNGDAAKQQFRRFADTYFSQFIRTPFGMMRLDPQDAGPGYRNVIGIPGGINSPFMSVLREANVHGMRLVEGRGNEYERGQPSEPDALNIVYILDSSQLPFYRAEQYHQFHNGIGERFPAAYTQGLKEVALRAGRINPTGCPEYTYAK